MEDRLAEGAAASVSNSRDGSNSASSSDNRRCYLCSVCGATRSKRSVMEAHIRGHPPEHEASFSILGSDCRRYTCAVCGTARSKFALLQKHMLEHASTENNDDDPSITSSVPARKRKFLECEQCGYQTKKQSVLRQHRVSHSSELHWQCTRAVPRRVTSQEVLVAPSYR